MKTRKPKDAPKVRLGFEVKVVEMEFGQELRVNAEIFHEQGKFSSAMSTFKLRAELEKGADANAAADLLIEMVVEKVGSTVKDRIDEILEAIENRSFA
jgi:hypothetical protein